MPYRRRSYRGRRRRSKQAWYNRRYSAKDLALKALRNTKYIRGLVNSEMFHKDFATNAAQIYNTGSVYALTEISQGNTMGQRTGNSILLRNLSQRIRLTKSTSANTTVVRMILFYDRQQVSDSYPTLANLLQSVSVDAPLNSDNFGRFKIVTSKVIVLDSNRPMWHKESFKSMYQHVRYNGNASTDIQKNGLYLAFISDQVTNVPLLDIYTRLSYRDN